jgi:hypothetical protein
MALSTISTRYPSQGIKLEKYQSIPRRVIQKLKELELSIFNRGIGHVIDERKTNALRSLDIEINRNYDARSFLLHPTTRNSPALDD